MVNTVRQEAGDDALQIGQVVGNVYVHYSGQSLQTDHERATPIVFRRVAEKLESQLREWSSLYTSLDVEPLVVRVGTDLQPSGEPAVPVTKEVAISDRLVLLGSAGTGKTSSLRYIAQAASRELAGGSDAALHACLYVELSRFRQPSGLSPVDSILVLLAEVIQAWGGCDELPSLESVRSALRDHHLLLMFDGLNEVAPDIRSFCLAGLLDLTAAFPQHRYVLASRPYQFPPLDSWRIVSLRPLGVCPRIEFFKEATAGMSRNREQSKSDLCSNVDRRSHRRFA
jgi:predicted NACHT family NTPase